MRGVLVYGGGGHGKTLIDLVRTAGSFEPVGVVDTALPPGSEVLGVPVLGGDEALHDLRAQGHTHAINAVGGIAKVEHRVRAFELLTTAGFELPAIVHPSAVVDPSATVAAGAQVLAHAYVGSEAVVGFGCILNTSAVVSHDCVLEEVVNVSPGALLAGGVRVGAHTLVGMGVMAHLGITIGARGRIGSGAVLTADVPDDARVASGSVWPTEG